MLFVSIKKYNELQDRLFKELQEKYTWDYLLNRSIDALENVLRLRLLRDVDKECIKALLNLLVENDIPLSTFEASLVDQTLNQ